jgi:hypothetical protein
MKHPVKLLPVAPDRCHASSRMNGPDPVGISRLLLSQCTRPRELRFPDGRYPDACRDFSPLVHGDLSSVQLRRSDGCRRPCTKSNGSRCVRLFTSLNLSSVCRSSSLLPSLTSIRCLLTEFANKPSSPKPTTQ